MTTSPLAPNGTPVPLDQQGGASEELCAGFRLWIDRAPGVGVSCCERVVLGGGLGGSTPNLVRFMAPLSRDHATLIRTGEGYVLDPQARVRVQGRLVGCPTGLPREAELLLGDVVRVKFSMPSPLSDAAVLEFVSPHIPAGGIERLVLMSESLLMGSQGDAHVRVPHAVRGLILLRQEGKLTVLPRPDHIGNANGAATDAAPSPIPLGLGESLEIGGVRMRCEAWTSSDGERGQSWPR